MVCDQRFTVAEADAPSLKAPMPSAAPLAALERRLVAVGGGEARLWGLVDGSGCASLSEADRLTVTTDDDEMEPLRDERRAWGCRGCGCARASSPAPGWPSPRAVSAVAVAAGGLAMSILESRHSGCVSQAKPTVNAMRMQAWLPKQERAEQASGQ